MSAKRLISVLLMVAFVFALSGEGQQTVTEKGSSAEQNHLKFFGYYHTDGFPFGNEDYIDDLAELKNSNVAIIAQWHERDELDDLLSRYSRNGIKVFISVYDVFFEYKVHVPGIRSSVNMHPSWETNWGEFKEKIVGNEEHILGFYFDEPYWNGVSERDFLTATALIRRDYADMRILACTTMPSLNPAGSGASGKGINEISPSYFDFVTDAAFDVYAPWETWADYPDLLQRLKTKLQKKQDIWLVPWAFTNESDDSSAEVLKKNIEKLYALGKAEPRCVGLLCFSFASGDEADFGSGCHRLFDPRHRLYAPELKNTHIRIGRSIVFPLDEGSK